MLKTFIIIFVFSSQLLFSQNNDLKIEENILTDHIGIIYMGTEYGLSDEFSLQDEVLVLEVFYGNYLQIYKGFVEG